MTPRDAATRRDWALLALALAWLAATAWMRALSLPDEGRYVGVAWEMLRSGDWVTPTLDGLPYFHKPPLFYWITAASLSAFGMHEWAARLAPWLGAAMAVAAIHVFALRWSGRRVARWSVFAFVTQPWIFLGSQFANLDMLVAGCIAVTTLALADAALSMQRGEAARRALAIAYVFAALGFLAKGLIGAVLPALAITLWLLALREHRLLLRLLWWPGLLLFAVLAAPWVIANELRHPGFAHYFFVVQHFSRYTQGGFNNQHPMWFFPAVLALAALPWTLLLPQCARMSFWRAPVDGARRQLAWLWLLSVLVFFSLPQSKLVGYIFPAAMPLALLAGEAAAQMAQHASRRRLAQAVAVVGAALCVGAMAVLSFVPQPSRRDIALELRHRVKPGDGVVFLHEYYFDIPFYARLAGPVAVVADWADPKERAHDSWLKELADAGEFDPQLARGLLLQRSELPAHACGAHPIWLIGTSGTTAAYPQLKRLPEVARSGDVVLWRAGDCLQAIR